MKTKPLKSSAYASVCTYISAVNVRPASTISACSHVSLCRQYSCTRIRRSLACTSSTLYFE